MASEQVRTVFVHAHAIHGQASELFHMLAKGCESERNRMLLDYLSRHEKQLADAITTIQGETSDKVLDTWVQSSEDTSRLVNNATSVATPRPDASWDELVEYGLRVDELALRAYQDLASRSEPEWLRDVFQQMYEMELQEEKQVARQTLRGMDL